MPGEFAEGFAVADVYAAALYALVAEAGRAAETREALQELIRLVEQEPAFGRFLRADVVDDDQRRDSLERMFRGRLSDELLNTLLVMNRHGRVGLLPELLRAFVLREERARGQIEVLATSAVKLDEPQRVEIERWAAEVSGQEPLIEYRVDPEIIGGLIVQIGDYRFDDSLRRHLQEAKDRLLERSSRGLATGFDHDIVQPDRGAP